MIALFTSVQGFLLLIGVFALGAIGSLFLHREDEAANWWGNGFAVIGSVLGLLFGGALLTTGKVLSFSLATSFPALSFTLNFDRLSGLFIALISFIALASSIYGIGYARHYYGKYSIGALGFFYNAFILGMLLVVTAYNLLFFLIAWEIMSLTSYFLVVYEKREEQSIKAGSLYFIMTHAGTAFILFAFLLLYKATGSFDIAVIKANISAISPLTENLIFIFALIGFGAKAGIIPLHIWLPSAHPAAPSHVSALMSGVMIKTSIYMFTRLFFDILPHTPIWWGYAILIFGAISSLLGVLYALSESDLKRLLAYSSIENIGIILLGLGSSLVFLAYGMNSFAILGLAAALFHTMNHASFKGLLFLGAGSVISKTHTRNIEQYGGLIKFMPVTAAFFLIGSMAISAMPFLNGFASEWATFQSLFGGITNFNIATKFIFVLSLGALAFTGGLAAACFVKAFGLTFLARPRSDEARHAKESGFAFQIGMALLSGLIVFLGLRASTVLSMLSDIAQSLTRLSGFQSPVSSTAGALEVGNFASISMPVLFSGLAVSLIAVYLIVSIFTRNRKVETGITWNCGTPATPRMEITSTAFARSIVKVFQGILQTSSQTEIEYNDAKFRYFPKSSTYTINSKDVYRLYIYDPLHKVVAKISDQARRIQSGNINLYILYFFLVFLILIFLIGR